VTRRAHAKVNVFLRVMGRREDGFHDLETVVLPISLHDVVTATEAPPGHLSIEIEGDVELTRLVSTVPGENLAGRAVEALARRAGRDGSSPGVSLRLDKRIPVAAGLGGGSADAAAALLAADEVWSCGLEAFALAELGAALGSDVPAMLAAEPVLASGRGERLVSLHASSVWWVLKPFGFAVSAADAYAWWDDDPVTGPDPGVLIAALEIGDVELLGDALFNDLQPGVVAHNPEVGRAVDAFVEAGALGAFMSGSGPTVAALARHLGHADALAAAVPGSIVVSGPPARGEHGPS
jgi:4-diphosphocytidyl-2-C-methyl-D-erythritol kinase